METLQEHEAAVEKLERGELAYDEYGEPGPDGNCQRTDPERLSPSERSSLLCSQAYHVDSSLVRKLWSPPYRAWSRELSARCRAVLGREKEAHALLGPNGAPRFEAAVDPGTGRPIAAIY